MEEKMVGLGSQYAWTGRDSQGEALDDPHQDQQDRDRRDQHLMPHDFGQRVNRSVNQPRAVVAGAGLARA